MPVLRVPVGRRRGTPFGTSANSDRPQSYGTHLGDFRVEPRVLAIAAMAIPVGAAAALAADGLLKLIGLITNLVFYQRFSTAMVLQSIPASTVASATESPRAVVHPDNTLREVADELAGAAVTSAVVVDRAHPSRLLGIVTLEHLLLARRRDLHEESHRERLLSIRPLRLSAPAPP